MDSDVPAGVRFQIATAELNQYRQIRYQAELRRRVATRAEDEKMKDSLTADLVKIEAAIDQLSEELASIEQEKKEPVGG